MNPSHPLSTPNASFILLIATLVSHSPQYHRVRDLDDAHGLSPWYLLFNAMSTTEQLTVILNFFVAGGDAQKNGWSMVGSPPRTMDWFNLGQIGIQWACAMRIFVLSLSTRPMRPFTKPMVMVVYIIWFCVTLAPVAPLIFPSNTKEPHLVHTHQHVLTPSATILLPLGFLAQALTTSWHRHPLQLSLRSLTLQCITYGLVGVSLFYRFPDPLPSESDEWTRPLEWYMAVGWASIDALLYSLGQGILLILAVGTMVSSPRRRERRWRFWRRRQEERPLLERVASGLTIGPARSPERGDIFARSKSPERHVFGRAKSPERGMFGRARSPERTSLFSRPKTPERSSMFSRKPKSPERQPLLGAFRQNDKGKGKHPRRTRSLERTPLLTRLNSGLSNVTIASASKSPPDSRAGSPANSPARESILSRMASGEFRPSG